MSSPDAVTGTTWVFLVLTAVFAVVDWYAVARDRRQLEYAAKPATLLALLLVALSLEPVDPTARTWFVVALVLSLAGDVLLMVPRNLFVAGLAAFLLGHGAYVVGLLEVGVSAGWLALGAVLVTAGVSTVGIRIVRAVRESDEPGMAVPVVAYVVVISLMVVCAVGTGSGLAASGSVLFYGSDALIAWNRFVETLVGGRLAIMITYHLGQAGLVLSLAA
ncbi:MAG: lysoplasmalogenase [Acidimicrobiia bacterium]|nr:lysoplasmalogenase [Acidimicrobiia bacterium]